ncbi:hypothetical protein L2E82_06496 [Cichorium intybus]|uniref:Uncharacterized protein n=1 Tax=Cichorium intybus TaxID=13427 RepID=A0ACB9HAZ1_CICIN|nr:hypothetical protein L2E82_06496 [Cichorium intybus]
MEKEHFLLLIIFYFFIMITIGSANDDCRPAFCGHHEPEVRFPFRILSRQPARCGYPGFDLSCDKQNRTILPLPSSLSYIVKRISYASQVINIDPEFCRPNRIVGVNITDTPFSYSTLWMKSYTFYNCSLQNSDIMYPGVPLQCLSSENYSVIAVRTDPFSPGYMPSNCKVMKTVVVPVRSNSDIREALELVWFTPSCGSCERKGDVCGLKKSDDGQIICVKSSRGTSRSAKYGLSIGIGVPALVCIIGIVCYVFFRKHGYNNTRNQSIDRLSIAITPQIALRTGLDGPTIESYPKTVLGESCRLPNDDGTCAICLCDYKPKESLRTIPECNHYFHYECIDEWLKLNATCPVCRNTPESSALNYSENIDPIEVSMDSSKVDTNSNNGLEDQRNDEFEDEEGNHEETKVENSNEDVKEEPEEIDASMEEKLQNLQDKSVNSSPNSNIDSNNLDSPTNDLDFDDRFLSDGDFELEFDEKGQHNWSNSEFLTENDFGSKSKTEKNLSNTPHFHPTPTPYPSPSSLCSSFSSSSFPIQFPVQISTSGFLSTFTSMILPFLVVGS